MPQKIKQSLLLLWFVDSSMPLELEWWTRNNISFCYWIEYGCIGDHNAYHHAAILHLLMPEPLGGQQSCKKTATSPSNPSPHKPLPQMRRRGELIGLKACQHRSKQLTMLMLFVGLLMLRRVVDPTWKFSHRRELFVQRTCLHYKVN